MSENIVFFYLSFNVLIYQLTLQQNVGFSVLIANITSLISCIVVILLFNLIMNLLDLKIIIKFIYK